LQAHFSERDAAYWFPETTSKIKFSILKLSNHIFAIYLLNEPSKLRRQILSWLTSQRIDLDFKYCLGTKMTNFYHPMTLILATATGIIGHVFDRMFAFDNPYLAILLASIGIFIIPIFLKLVPNVVESIQTDIQTSDNHLPLT